MSIQTKINKAQKENSMYDIIKSHGWTVESVSGGYVIFTRASAKTIVLEFATGLTWLSGR